MAKTSGKKPVKRPAAATKRRPKRPTRRQILVRRVVAAIVLLALVGLVAWGAWAIAKAITESFSSSSTPTMEETVNPSPSSSAEWAALDEQDRLKALKGVKPEVCPSGDVALTLDVANRSGGDYNLVAKLTNKFPIPCLIDTPDQRIDVVITSGDETIWTSASCPGEAVTLLLSPDEETTRTIVWPAQHRTAGCEAGEAAKPGVYKAKVSIGGTSETTSFEVR
ncbi:hypothetical protein BSZ39_06685 [Bowdeniella nasicola]|uniref:Intracellular proteinase inhibitor BsuPI domain-containing protein n=1 Tax=Bowdeniella nasicola TaxID=208480 RepID=A0A1Q5Q250_9ACTO|nr:hypothetical protein [Bowdeniella nasicola]OKL53928.1 hypothetical protein BSZ39_06685 [Bowdeniella nasicola]